MLPMIAKPVRSAERWGRRKRERKRDREKERTESTQYQVLGADFPDY
jgi:hypothetical protein